MKSPSEYSYWQAITIHKSAISLFKIWRTMTCVDTILSVFESILYINSTHYQCVARLCNAKEVETWDIIVTDRPYTDIHWHSENNQNLLHEGHVHFDSIDNEKTVLCVSLHFFFPILEGSRSDILGNDFEQQLAEDLRRFKLAVEANEFSVHTDEQEGFAEGFSAPPPPEIT